MTYIPMYKRMQGGPKLNHQMSDEERYGVYEEYGITHGTPGSASEDDVRGMLRAVQGSGWCREARIEAHEALHWYTVNNVEFGGVSDVLEEVDASLRSTLYEKDGE